MQPDHDVSLHAFDAHRGYALFCADAYEGGRAWDFPSSPTLGQATLYGYRVATVTNVVEGVEGTQQVVVERAIGTVRTYLVPWPGETEANFARRRSLALYVNLVEPIVDEYIDAILPRVTRQLGAAEQYLENLDGDGQNWSSLVENVGLQAALDGVTAVLIDAPKNNPARTRAEEVALGIGLRATVIPLASWAWMRLDDEGCIKEFAYVDAPAVDPTATTQCVRLWVWRAADPLDAQSAAEGEKPDPGGWFLYENNLTVGVSLGDFGKNGASRGKILRSGPLNPALNGKLPLFFAYHRKVPTSRVPRGKSLAAGPAAAGRQIYQLLSQIEDTQRRTPPFLSVPTSTKGGLEPELQMKAGPDVSLPAPEGAGTPSWVAFPSESLQDLRAHAAFLMGIAFRVSGLELQADTSAQVQSGEALRVRSRGFESRAAKFAKNLADFERRAFNAIAALLNIDRSTMSATYPQRYVLSDPSELLAAAMLFMQSFGEYVGPEGVTEVVRQGLNAALNLDETQLNALVAEVKARSAMPPKGV
jgi:hypothetical protein